MKKYLKIISLLLATVILCLSFASCKSDSLPSNDNGDIVMRYGDLTIAEKEYLYVLSTFKSQVIDYYQSVASMYGYSYDESDILPMQLSEEFTVAEYIEEMAKEFCQQILIFEHLCNESGLEITNQEDLDELNSYLSDLEYAYGGNDLFEIELARLGFTRGAIERYAKTNILYELVYDYRYGENGVAKVAEESVVAEFIENYIKYEGALYSYIDYETEESHIFEYADSDVLDYFNNNYVKVRHVLYGTTNANGTALSDEKKAAQKQNAENALVALDSGVKTLDDYKEDTDDSGYEYIFTYGEMVEEFETAAFEMAVGEFRIVETKYGFHVMEKLAIAQEDFEGKPDKDGKLSGGMKENVIVAMTTAEIRKQGLELYEKLSNGEVTEFPKEIKDVEYYHYMEPNLISKDQTTYQTFIDMVSKMENGEYSEQNFPKDATYIIKRLELTAEDITAEIYNTIETDLAFASFGEYVQSYYDKVEVVNEVIERFDVTTVSILDSEFYEFG